MATFAPAYKLSLGHTIQPGLVTLGKFNGIDPSLAFAASNDSIIIHSPHDTTNANNSTGVNANTRTLSINRKITALTCGSLNSMAVRPADQLLIGGESSLLCYDVHENKDLFFQEVKDGCHSLTVARGLSSSLGNPPLAIIGGNNAVAGLDLMGVESYWTATSDKVTALTTRSLNRDTDELLIGTADSYVRGFQRTDQTFEIVEHAPVDHLASINQSNKQTAFAYALNNGTIGVYIGQSRTWMAKSKHAVTALATYDLDGDGVEEIVTGWSHGRLEVRKSDTGALVYKDKYNERIAALVQADYRSEGRDAIIACSVSGELRGYQSIDQNAINQSIAAGVAAVIPVLMDEEMVKEQRKSMYDRKEELMSELKYYEAALQTAKEPKPLPTQSVTPATNPSQTQLSVNIKPNKANGCQILTVATDNDCVIKVLCIQCEGLFDDTDSKVLIPGKEKLSMSCSMSLKWTKNVPVVLTIRAIVGHRGSSNDCVLEMNASLPRFANLLYCKPRDMQMPQPKSTITFTTVERVNRLVLWLNTAFLLDTNPAVTQTGQATPSPLILSVNSDSLTVSFIHICTMTPLIIKFTPDSGGTIVIKTDNIELAGDLIQDFARYCKVPELTSVAEFAEDFKQAEQAMAYITEFNSSRIKMSADMAESTQNIKVTLIKSEDARMLEIPELIQSKYSACYNANNEVLSDYAKRDANQAELFKYLKYINQLIQNASNLRVGQAKSKLIQSARQAIKTSNVKAFIKTIRVGAD